MPIKKTSNTEKPSHVGRFKKGQRRPPGAGRKPGSPNKITRAVKETFEAAFSELQRDPKTELASWARRNAANLREFYRIAARFIPLQVANPDGTNLIPPIEAENSLLEVARGIGFILSGATRITEARSQITIDAPVPETQGRAEVTAETVAAVDATQKRPATIAAQTDVGLLSEEDQELEKAERLFDLEVSREIRSRPTTSMPVAQAPGPWRNWRR